MSSLRRMVGIVKQRTNDSLFDVVAKHLTAAHRDTLDALLEVPEDAKESPFATLCRTPGRANTKNLKALADHADWSETLAAPQTALVDIMLVKLEQWADEARRMIATELKEYRAPRRHALLIALVHVTRGRILDDEVTMLLKSMRKIEHQSRESLQAWLDERQASSEQLIVILLDLARAHQNNGALGLDRHAAAIFTAAGGSHNIVTRCEARLQHRVRDWCPFARKRVLPASMPDKLSIVRVLTSCLARKLYSHE